MMRNRNVLNPIVLLILIILILSGCTEVTKTTLDSDIDESAGNLVNKESLTFRITWKTYSGRGEAIKNIVNSYNQVNQTDYNIEVIDGDEDSKAISELMDQKDKVDIYVLPYRYVQWLGDERHLQELTEVFEHDKKFFYEELWNLGVVEDKLYGIPWVGHSMGLIYNKGILDEAGVNPDTIESLQDLIVACEKIEESTSARGIGLVGADHNDVSWMVNQFIYGFGGMLINEDGTKVAVNSDESRLALDFYLNVLGNHAQATWKDDTGVEVMEAFRKQEIGFEIQGLWGITDVWKNGNDFEVGVIPLERIGLFPEVGPLMLSIQSGLSDEKKAAAVEFIDFMISTKAQQMIMLGEYSPEHDAYYPFRLPVRMDIEETNIFDKYPEFTVFLSGFKHPSVDVPTPKWQVIKDQIYAPNLHRLMIGELSIEEFLEKVQIEGDAILN